MRSYYHETRCANSLIRGLYGGHSAAGLVQAAMQPLQSRGGPLVFDEHPRLHRLRAIASGAANFPRLLCADAAHGRTVKGSRHGIPKRLAPEIFI